ncbi:MAG: hypothetical protein ACKPKO_44985, partial [Candidatus Fonsibacter sp.]
METKSDSTSKMEPTSMTGVFVGYELTTVCRWAVWDLDEFSQMDVSTKSSALSRKMRKPHKVKVLDLPDEGIVFPLKSEYDRDHYTLEGDEAEYSAVTARTAWNGRCIGPIIPHGDRWVPMGQHWIRLHVVSRS